jgi:hypothetical protein
MDTVEQIKKSAKKYIVDPLSKINIGIRLSNLSVTTPPYSSASSSASGKVPASANWIAQRNLFMES